MRNVVRNVVRNVLLAAAAAASLSIAQPASAQPPAPAPPQAEAAAPKPNDYSDLKSWLCRPGRKGDACDVDETSTTVAADGKLTRETWSADANAPIDCFYVYPDDLDRPDADQRHDRRPGGAERRPAAVRAVRVRMQAVRAACIARSRSPDSAAC